MFGLICQRTLLLELSIAYHTLSKIQGHTEKQIFAINLATPDARLKQIHLDIDGPLRLVKDINISLQ